MNCSTLRTHILVSGGELLARAPLGSARLAEVASTRLTLEQVLGEFPTMRALATAILDHERASMRAIQERVSALPEPSNRVIRAFRLVGENLASDIVVRAGVRIAGESREFFPERRLDPFKTWEAFVRAQLEAECAAGRSLTCDVERATWLIVAAGMGAKDLVAFHGKWESAAEILERTAEDMLGLIVDFE